MILLFSVAISVSKRLLLIIGRLLIELSEASQFRKAILFLISHSKTVLSPSISKLINYLSPIVSISHIYHDIIRIFNHSLTELERSEYNDEECLKYISFLAAYSLEIFYQHSKTFEFANIKDTVRANSRIYGFLPSSANDYAPFSY